MRLKLQRLVILILVLTLGLIPTQSARAAGTIYFVGNNCVVPVCNGTSWTVAFPTLQEALSAAVSGDQIWVEAGTYYPDEGAGQTPNDRNATFTMKNGVQIFGGFAGTETVLGQRNVVANITILSGDIDKNDVVSANGFTIIGSNAFHVVTGSGKNNTAVLNGFTVQLGAASGVGGLTPVGGGIINDGGNPSYQDLIVYNNFASLGGAGMYNRGASPILSNVKFLKNNASLDGGGMYNYLGSSPTLTNVTLDGNTAATNGGGMYNSDNSSPTITNGSMVNNIAGTAASGEGGAIYNGNGSAPTITNAAISANKADNGAGIYNWESNPTINGTTISNNVAFNHGGGMYNNNSSPTLNQVPIKNNSASNNGGGMYNDGANPVLNTVTFDGNTALLGAGMYNDASAPTVTHTSFQNNSATFNGGGMYNLSSNALLGNVTFSGNAGDGNGGGMYNDASAPIMANVTFSANAIQNNGGGMYNTQSSPKLTNVTFSGNTATSGGGMYNNTNSVPKLVNTLIANSASGGDCVNANGSSLNAASVNNLIEDAANDCGLINAVNGNIVGQDPKLDVLKNNGGSTLTFGLLTGSPALEAGTNTGCPLFDQRARKRPQGAKCDIGAVEGNATVAISSTGTQDGWVLESGENTSVGGALNDAATTLRVGDDAQDKQYRSIVSFNSGPALPDSATIVKAVLRVKHQGITGGGNPITAFQGFVLDIRRGPFGAVDLQPGDWQATATQSTGIFSPTLNGGFYFIDFTPFSANLNKLATNDGLTQIRIRFKLGDNDNATANFLSLFSGDAAATSRPQLIVEYFVP